MIRIIRNFATFLLIAPVSLSCQEMTHESAAGTAIKVEVTGEKGNYQLTRGGEPYQVRGAGFDYPDMESFAAHGGNSIRTWATDAAGDKTLELLDKAHSLGITVSLCLYTAPERSGFDYDDAEAVARQFESHRSEVLRYKDHPALLTWIIGNELNHDFTNPAVYDAVNDISRMIRELDPNHPTTTTIAGFSKHMADTISERAPDLDFISIQVYGMLYALPDLFQEMNFDAPYFITEWGAIGHWEVSATDWGAPLEQNSSEKADTYLRGYREVIEPYSGQNIGNYVFLWGQKQEKTPTWYGIFTETGEETEVIDVMEYIWTGDWPENRTPRVNSMQLNGRTANDNVRLKAGETYRAEIDITEPDGDPVSFLWQVKKESKATQVGGDYEAAISNLRGLINDPARREIEITAPSKTGAYRLFVYAYDGRGHAAHANIPFYVNKKEGPKEK